MGAEQESRRMILPDELRSMADRVGLEMPQAATMMMGATDAICELQAENEKLRLQIHWLKKGNTYAYEEGYNDGATNYELDHCPSCKNIVDLQDALDKNAKLRKLFASTISNYVYAYMDDTSARYPCDLCDESSMQQCDYLHDRQCPFYMKLRELGVEVD